MNIYLDIDGVILGNENRPTKHVKEFLKYLTDNYPTFWLTNHCKGDSNRTISFLSSLLDPETIAIAKKIKPTNWEISKTEAVDFNEPFLWFEDVLFDFEKENLEKHNALGNWVEVDLNGNADQLKDFVENFPSPK
jgi:hypothetical protein